VEIEVQVLDDPICVPAMLPEHNALAEAIEPRLAPTLHAGVIGHLQVDLEGKVPVRELVAVSPVAKTVSNYISMQ
jgi:hypothetical protein